MKIVKSLLPALSLLLTVPAFADETNLTIGTAEGNTDYGIAKVKTLVFSESSMQVKLADGTTSAEFPYANLQKIYFSEVSSGVQTVELDKGITITMDAERNNLIVNGNVDGEVNIYNLAGVKVINQTNGNGTIFIGDLANGVYVLEINKKAIKFKK